MQQEDNNTIPIETINMALDTDRALQESRVAKVKAMGNVILKTQGDTTIPHIKDRNMITLLKSIMTTHKMI